MDKPIKLTITNQTNEPQTARILYALPRLDSNFGLPEGVSVELSGGGPVFTTYEKFLAYLIAICLPVRFTSSSNNRQLAFYYLDMFGIEKPIEPQLDKNGHPRPANLFSFLLPQKKQKRHNFELWQPEKWNIADTHEPVIWTFSHFIDLNLTQKQVFELEFLVIQK